MSHTLSFHWPDVLNQHITQLYHESQNLDVNEFVQFAMRLLSELADSTEVSWQVSDIHSVHSTCLVGREMDHLGECSVVLDAYSVRHSFNVHTTGRRFSAAEDSSLRFFCDHMVAALNQNIRAHIKRNDEDAIATLDGVVMFGTESFLAAILDVKALMISVNENQNEAGKASLLEQGEKVLFSEIEGNLVFTSLFDMSAYKERLTKRELLVACLIGQMKSNADIAERLMVSVKTVENQLTKIYSKLDISNRAELVSLLNR
jgi:DNA-binding CsgD family transcriptional regulator